MCGCYITSSALVFSPLQTDLNIARETFSRFLGLYPFCYGYWKKYSELVRKLSGAEPARAVLEEGVAAVPLSVDLWLHYTSFAASFYKDSPQAEELLRRSLSLSHEKFTHTHTHTITYSINTVC